MQALTCEVARMQKLTAAPQPVSHLPHVETVPLPASPSSVRCGCQCPSLSHTRFRHGGSAVEDELFSGLCQCLVPAVQCMTSLFNCQMWAPAQLSRHVICCVLFTSAARHRRISPAQRPDQQPARSGRRRRPTSCRTRACCSGRAPMPAAPRRSSTGRRRPVGSLRWLRHFPQPRAAFRRRSALRLSRPLSPLVEAAQGQCRVRVAATVLQAMQPAQCPA